MANNADDYDEFQTEMVRRQMEMEFGFHSSDDGSDDSSDDGSGMLESEAQRLAADREHQRLLHDPHLPLQRECCLLVLNLVSSTLSCIRQPRPRLLVLDVCGFV